MARYKDPGFFRGQGGLTQDEVDHAARKETMTWVPYLAAVVKGDVSHNHFGHHGVEDLYAPSMLATASPGTVTMPFVAGKRDPESGYARRQYAASVDDGEGVRFEFTAALKKELMGRAAEYRARNAALQSGIARPFSASVPPGGDTPASQVVGPLTQIPFVMRVLGMPFENYFIQLLFTKIALQQLHAEIPETDWIAANLQLEETQYVENRRPNFDSHFFLAKRNEVAFVIPREYRMRATIDPFPTYVKTAGIALREAREALALLALSKLPNMNGGALFTNNENIPDPQADASGGWPAAANNSIAFYERIFAAYYTATRRQIDSIVMHPEDFFNYETNFFSQGFGKYPSAEEWGLVQFPGSRVRRRCAISPFCPRGVAYFFDSSFVFAGEGPMVTESWAKPESNSDAGAFRDYVDMVVQNPKRAGFKGIITGGPGNLNGEITTLRKARDLMKPGDDVLEDAH